jgi:putative ABC transport system substrate-binding protein
MGLGFATSLGRPGGNVTGLSDMGADLVGKQLDLLKQAVPQLRQVTILTSAADGAKESARQRALQPAQALGISLRVDEVGDRAGVDQIFASARNQHPDGILVLSAELFDYASLSRMAKLARQEKIPLASDWEITTTEGGLISYGASYAPQAQRAASYADKILKGASASDLPIEQPTEFRLVVNLDTARALGLSVPQSILLLADDVIE